MPNKLYIVNGQIVNDLILHSQYFSEFLYVVDDETATLKPDGSLFLHFVQGNGYVEACLVEDVGKLRHLDLHVFPAFGNDGVGKNEPDNFVLNCVVGKMAQKPFRLLVFVADNVHEVDFDYVVCHEMTEQHALVDGKCAACSVEGVGA